MQTIELILILIAIIASIIESYFDSRKINKGERPEHAISAGVRVIVCWVASVILLVFPYNLIFTAILLTAYWLPFDIFVNIFTGRPSYLLGKTALTDRITRKLGADLHGWTALKGVLLALLLLIYKYI